MIKFKQEEYIHDDELNAISRVCYSYVIEGCKVEQTEPLAMKVKVNEGYVKIKDRLIYVEETELTVNESDPSYNRADLVIVKYDGSLEVVEGVLGSGNDVYPNGPLKSGTYDVDNSCVLARVYVMAGSSVITDSNIKDLRVINNSTSESGGSCEIHPFMMLGG